MKETENLQIDTLGEWKRTHDCGSLTTADVGREVVADGADKRGLYTDPIDNLTNLMRK